MAFIYLWIIITITTILKVLKHSKGKNLRQRAKIIWIGTKLFFLTPALMIFVITIITNLIVIFELTNLDSITIDVIGLSSLITILFLLMLFWEIIQKWEKEIQSFEKAVEK